MQYSAVQKSEVKNSTVLFSKVECIAVSTKSFQYIFRNSLMCEGAQPVSKRYTGNTGNVLIVKVNNKETTESAQL